MTVATRNCALKNCVILHPVTMWKFVLNYETMKHVVTRKAEACVFFQHVDIEEDIWALPELDVIFTSWDGKSDIFVNRLYLSLCVRKPTIWVPTRSNTNGAVQSQNMVRGWKIWI